MLDSSQQHVDPPPARQKSAQRRSSLWFACETLREERFRTEVIHMNTDTAAFVDENRMQDG